MKLKILPSSKLGLINSFSKLLSHKSIFFYNLWKSEIYTKFNLKNFYKKEIFKALENWNYFTDLVQTNIEILSDVTEDWVPRIKNRLPCVIPYRDNQKIFKILRNKGITNDIRMFNVNLDDNNPKYEKVYSIPVHFQVNNEFLIQIKSILE